MLIAFLSENSEMAGRNVNLTAETKITVQCTFHIHVPQLFEEESPIFFRSCLLELYSVQSITLKGY